MVLSESVPADIDKVLLGLEAKEFTVESSTLQSLQQLIQWVADLALNILAKLPDNRGMIGMTRNSGVSKMQNYSESNPVLPLHLFCSTTSAKTSLLWTVFVNCLWWCASGAWYALNACPFLCVQPKIWTSWPLSSDCSHGSHSTPTNQTIYFWMNAAYCRVKFSSRSCSVSHHNIRLHHRFYSTWSICRSR